MNRVAIALIQLYRHSLGRLMPGRCRFYPTCSAYALECFERFSFFRALGKTVWRLMRCTPFSKGYFDPVDSSATECSHNVPAAVSESRHQEHS